jgi:hypothetical protein
MRDRRLRYLCAATIAVVAVCCQPSAAFADKGSGHGGDSHSGGSGSGGHGSDDGSGSSGSSGHGGGGDDGDERGGDDRGGADKSGADKSGADKSGDGKSRDDRGRDDDRHDGGDEKRAYKGGWREQIRKGNYEVFDPAGRLVIRRKVTLSDYLRF